MAEKSVADREPAHLTPTAELARILVRAAMGDHDVESLKTLSEVSGLTVRVLQRRCQAAGAGARQCVQFVQCLIVLLTVEGDWAPAALLPYSDPRTVARLLEKAGFKGPDRPTLRGYVRNQQFLTDTILKEALSAELGCMNRL